MKFHLKAQSARLERMHAQLAGEALEAKLMWEADQRASAELQATRNAMPLSQRAPIALLRKMESAKLRVEHAEYLYDKACEARNALRALIRAGSIEL